MESPVLRSFTGPNRHPEARSIFNLSALLIAPLSDGTFAICDRGQTVYMIVETFPNAAAFAQFYQLLNVSRMNAQAAYLGEPTTQELVRDLKRANQAIARQAIARQDSAPVDLTDLI